MKGSKSILIILLSVTLVAVKSSPKFGERLAKDVNNSSLIEVFRPSSSSQTTTGAVVSAKPANQSAAKDLNSNQNKDTKKVQHFGNERHVNYKFTTYHQKDDKIVDNNNNSGHELTSAAANQPAIDQRSGQVSAAAPVVAVAAPVPALTAGVHYTHRPPTPQQIEEQLRRHFPMVPDFNSFSFGFDMPFDVSSSERVNGRPLPPPPPQPPRRSNYNQFKHQSDANYDRESVEPDDQTFFSESVTDQSAGQDLDFQPNIPNGYPHPKQDPRVGYKKQVMGAQNTAGKPWGTKTSYTYKDPKNPNNFMEMSEVTMTMNREMDPQEAQSQVQHFLALAHSGQYGPFHAIPVPNDNDSDGDRHPNHNYQSDDSNANPDIVEPPEPKEPIFPKF